VAEENGGKKRGRYVEATEAREKKTECAIKLPVCLSALEPSVLLSVPVVDAECSEKTSAQSVHVQLGQLCFLAAGSVCGFALA
jgi:hypothetical protein